MKKFIFLLILPIFLGLIFSGCYYPTRVVYVPPEERFAPPPPSPPPAVSLEPIFFDFNKANITPDAKAILDKNAEWISKNPTAKIQIVGNCDERASNEYNMGLGKRRANAAKQYLVNLGIAADRLSTVSRGKEKPLDPGHDKNAWAENRRVDFNVAGELLGEQLKPRGEMDYDHPYPYPYYPWGYYDPLWGYPYWWGGLGFSYYYYPHFYYYGGYHSPWYGYYGGYDRGYHRGYHGGHHGGGSHGGGHRR